ncbi:hypothetical protein COBT_000039 [Conglomerata obtusa]
MLKLFFTYITYIVPRENLKGFNCLIYKELKEICLACNKKGEIFKEQFFNENKYNKILIHVVPRNSSTNKIFVKRYLQNLLQSYLNKMPKDIKFNSYCIREYNHNDKEVHPLSIIHVFKIIYYSIIENQNYIEKAELMPECNIDHAEYCFNNACNLISEHIDTNSKIVIFDTFSKLEEHYALLYSVVKKILHGFFFTLDVNYYIFLLKFDNKKQSFEWSEDNILTNADNLPINVDEFQILSYSYTISDLCLKHSKNRNVKDDLSLYQIYEYKEKAVRLPLNSELKYQLQELYENTLYVKYDINCFDNINNNGFNFKKIKKKLKYLEFRNQIIIETLNKSFDFTINTLVKLDEGKQTSIKNTNFVAIASLYSNIFNKKKLVCRFIYRFTKQDNQYTLEETFNNLEMNHTNNFTYISYEVFKQTLQDFLKKQYFFDDCDILDLKYFVVKNVHTPAFKKVYHFNIDNDLFFKNTVKRLLEDLNTLKKLKNSNIHDFHIKLYHGTFSINSYLQQEPLGSQSIFNFIHVTHQLHDLDTTSETFNSYKTVIFDMYFKLNNEIKQFAIIVPIQDQKLNECMYNDFSAEILKCIMVQNLEDAKIYFLEHLNYLSLVFEHIIFEEHVFNAVKFASLGIQRLIYKKHFIDFVMCKVLMNDQRLINVVRKPFRIKDMELFSACINFRSFSYNETFKKILNFFVTNETYKKLKCYVIKRLDILYAEYRQKLLHLKPNKYNHLYMHDKNKIKDPELNFLLTDLITCDYIYIL